MKNGDRVRMRQTGATGTVVTMLTKRTDNRNEVWARVTWDRFGNTSDVRDPMNRLEVVS